MSDDEAEIDLDHLQREARRIRNNNITQGSRNSYQARQVDFLQWYLKHMQHLLNPAFIQLFEDNSPSKKDVLDYLLSENAVFPLLPQFSCQDFACWLVSLEKKDKSRIGYSALNSRRSALMDLYHQFQEPIPDNLKNDLGVFYSGLKRDGAVSAAKGEVTVKVGKDPLEFSLYCELGLFMLQQESPEYIFGHLYLLLCWNLMCRACSAATICFDHMGWRNDALGIIFAHMKNDQSGERKRDPRHIYANPIIPEICPILSLGIYWLCTPFESKPNKLFPGREQTERFRSLLSRILESEEFQTYLRNHGIDPDELGTHSIRKGSATYASSGSTACPSATAIHLRAGWVLHGVQDTYLRYQAAGDQHVGRTVSGLPGDQPEFAILPPMFTEDNEYIDEVIQICFRGMPKELFGIARFALASIVKHYEFLKSTLSKGHRLFTSPLFVDPQIIPHLLTMVECRLNRPTDRIKATGVPPHVSLMLMISSETNIMYEIIPKIEKIAPDAVAGIVQELEERAIGAGTVTRIKLRICFKASLNSLD